MPDIMRIVYQSLAAVAVAAAVLGLGALDLLEGPDLLLHDEFLRRSEPFPSSDVLLVEVTEEDIRAQGHWPLSDRRLAEALQLLADADVRIIGLDLYRDLPVSPGVELLKSVFANESRIIAVKKFGDPDLEGIPGSPILDASGRLGFNDLLPDQFGEAIRRTALFMTDSEGRSHASFAMMLALHALAAEGIRAGPDPDHPTHMRLGEGSLPPLDVGHGGYQGLDAAGYQIMMDYAAPRFEAITLGDLQAGRVPAGKLRDRVVVFGASAKSLRDELPVPLGGRRAGMEIHGHVVDQLRRVLLDWQEAVFVLAISLLGSLVGFGIGGRALFGAGALVFAVFAGLAVMFFAAYWAFELGWWIPMVAPMLAWVGSAGLITAWVSSREKAQRGQLMGIFARHVSPGVADEIWDRREEFLDAGRPRPQRLMVTVLFVDMKGYTSRAEVMDPAELMDWVNQFMERMADEISAHGGVVDDYFGDGIKANFGVPVPRTLEEEIDRDACHAASCALAMGEALDELNADYRARRLPECAMRIGIHTGMVVAGSLGAADRLKYTVVGDVVVTAQRLEATDAVSHDFELNPCRILASEETCKRLTAGFTTEVLDPISLKGKKELTQLRWLKKDADQVTQITA